MTLTQRPSSMLRKALVDIMGFLGSTIWKSKARNNW